MHRIRELLDNNITSFCNQIAVHLGYALGIRVAQRRTSNFELMQRMRSDIHNTGAWVLFNAHHHCRADASKWQVTELKSWLANKKLQTRVSTAESSGSRIKTVFYS